MSIEGYCETQQERIDDLQREAAFIITKKKELTGIENSLRLQAAAEPNFFKRFALNSKLNGIFWQKQKLYSRQYELQEALRPYGGIDYGDEWSDNIVRHH